MGLRNGRSAGNGEFAQKGDYIEGNGGHRPKVTFCDGSTSPGNYGWLFCVTLSLGFVADRYVKCGRRSGMFSPLLSVVILAVKELFMKSVSTSVRILSLLKQRDGTTWIGLVGGVQLTVVID
jgi:hypothetical protein